MAYTLGDMGDHEPLPSHFGHNAAKPPAPELAAPTGFKAWSTKQWTLVAVVSVLLGGASSVVLLQRLDDQAKDHWVRGWEAIPYFIKNTRDLTWQNMTGPAPEIAPGRVLMADSATSYVAPLGILDERALFAAVVDFADYVPKAQERPADAIAPPRLLDPEWVITFSADIQG
jgi:hypothetical protein